LTARSLPAAEYRFELEYRRSALSNSQQNGNAYVGSFSIFTPISQRFQLYFSVPFIQSDKGALSNTYHGNVGEKVEHSPAR